MRRLRPFGLAALAATTLVVAGVGAASANDTDYRCAIYGEGFVYSETTGFCIKISGHVRGGVRFGNGSNRKAEENLSFGLDARRETEFGTLRAVIEQPFNLSN